MPPSFGGSSSGTEHAQAGALERRRPCARAAAGSGRRRRRARRCRALRAAGDPHAAAAVACGEAVVEARADGRDRRAARRGRARPRGRARGRRARGDRARASRASCRPRSRGRQLVRAPLATVGHRLELHRRLALVVDVGAHAAERGHRVEQAAGARRHRRRDAGRGPARRPACQRSGSTPARRGRFLAERLAQPRARHPPRLADRRVAAGHPHREQRAGALEAAQVADQQLAAPDRAVGAVAGAVEDRPDRRARSPCSARQAARWAWWCCTPTSSTPSRSSAYLVDR